VHLAADGHIDHSIAQLKRAERAITTGSLFVALYIALVLFGLALGISKGALDYTKLFAIPSFMLVVGAPYVLWGSWQMVRLIKPLKDRTRSVPLDDNPGSWVDVLLPTLADNDGMEKVSNNRIMELQEEKAPTPVSLFDFTTDKLESPKS
jgi:hypothetical protein